MPKVILSSTTEIQIQGCLMPEHPVKGLDAIAWGAEGDFCGTWGRTGFVLLECGFRTGPHIPCL